MDPVWLPWCWGAGAACFLGLFWLCQPWRAEWAAGWQLVRKYPAAWGWPVGLAAADAGIRWWMDGVGQASPLPGMAAVAEAVAESLQGLHFGPGAALAGAVLLALDAWGMRRGFLKGVSSVMGWTGLRLVAVLLTGAVALTADLVLAGTGVPVVWHAVVAALAIPLVGWVSATVLGGLLLLMETMVRAPGKIAEVRWLESAAAHSVRLWPWALGHGLLWWLGRGVPDWAAAYVRGLLAVAAVALAFAPLGFLHVRQRAESRAGFLNAMELWKSKAWQPVAWLAAAVLVFYGWYLAGQGLRQVAQGWPEALRIGLATVHGFVHIGFTVMSLGAWAAFRLADSPPPPPPRRVRRR